ncbi:MAG: carboxypeptidase regulatory-like domain-containing protein, partial [Pyrinomonadaceae bacterium]
MKRSLLLVVVCLISVNALAQTRRVPRASAAAQTPTPKVSTQTLPIRRVILYSNGVAYIERRGAVTGHAEINLSFKQSQVDDVLKSMIVLDLGQGRIGAVSYNSSAPPSARLADIPFSIAAGTANENEGGLAGVLTQLQGARVIVSTANRTATGSIITVEERKSQDSNRSAVTTHAVVISTASGELMSFDLAEVRAIKLIDEGAQRDLSEFAIASASARRRDAKTIVVTSDGNGTREMLVSYTIAAPIWKTTYRVVLDSTGKPFFQGWAIVDNVSEEDWNSISLSLVSGSPVSFIQHIQKPFYRYRPVVPMPEDLNLNPQVYEPGEGGNSGGGGAAGTINGTVTDPNGAVVPGANVTITNMTTNQSWNTRTSNEGTYHSPVLSPGNYSVKVDSPGFKSHLRQYVSVTTALPANANISLEVGNISETVTVTATDGANVINQSSYSVGRLPLNRRVSGLLSL